MFSLGTLLSFHEKKVTNEKISTLPTVQCSDRQYSARRAWQFEQSHRIACKVINIADPSKRKNSSAPQLNSSTPPLKVIRHFNWAKLPRMWKISSHNFDTALLIINSNRTNKHLNIFSDSISFAWIWYNYVQIFKSFALFVSEISRVKFIMVRISRNSQ